MNPALENSMQDYRDQLNERVNNPNNDEQASTSSVQSSTEVEPSNTQNTTQNVNESINENRTAEAQNPYQQHPINYEEINKDVEARNQAARDDARQAAVHVTELNIKQDAVDTYMDASQNTDSEDEDDYDATYQYDPQKVYETSMDYSKNQALIEAFETTANNGLEQRHVSIMV